VALIAGEADHVFRNRRKSQNEKKLREMSANLYRPKGKGKISLRGKFNFRE